MKQCLEQPPQQTIPPAVRKIIQGPSGPGEIPLCPEWEPQSSKRWFTPLREICVQRGRDFWIDDCREPRRQEGSCSPDRRAGFDLWKKPSYGCTPAACLEDCQPGVFLYTSAEQLYHTELPWGFFFIIIIFLNYVIKQVSAIVTQKLKYFYICSYVHKSWTRGTRLVLYIFRQVWWTHVESNCRKRLMACAALLGLTAASSQVWCGDLQMKL